MRRLGPAALWVTLICVMSGMLLATSANATTIASLDIWYRRHFLDVGTTAVSTWVWIREDQTEATLFHHIISAYSVGDSWTETAATDPEFAQFAALVTNKVVQYPSMCGTATLANGNQDTACFGNAMPAHFPGYRIDAITLRIDSFAMIPASGSPPSVNADINATLTFDGVYLPEPGTAVLICLGVASATAFGRREHRANELGLARCSTQIEMSGFSKVEMSAFSSGPGYSRGHGDRDAPLRGAGSRALDRAGDRETADSA